MSVPIVRLMTEADLSTINRNCQIGDKTYILEEVLRGNAVDQLTSELKENLSKNVPSQFPSWFIT